MLPSVSAPSSPYLAASGAAPQPTESSTIIVTRSIFDNSVSLRWLAVGRADDRHRRAGPDAIGAGGAHLLGVFVRAHAARGLDAHLRADQLAHERDVFSGGAARTEAGRGLHEVRAGDLRQRAGDDLLFLVERAGLEDDLHLG